MLHYVCWVILVILQTSKCRRYDIEQEAHHLYSSNLRSVIERFRRTPEYLKILNDQTELLLINMDTIFVNTNIYYSDKMLEKVNENFGGNETRYLRTIRQMQFKKRLVKPQKKFKKIKKRRQGKSLDYYKNFHSALSLQQKNRMKDLGFEFAEHAIHAMISNTLPDDALPLSTLLPNGGHTPETITTTHHHEHEITQPSSPDTEATEPPTTEQQQTEDQG